MAASTLKSTGKYATTRKAARGFTKTGGGKRSAVHQVGTTRHYKGGKLGGKVTKVVARKAPTGKLVRVKMTGKKAEIIERYAKAKKAGGTRTPAVPTDDDVAEREAVARKFFNPTAVAAARDAFLARH
jgi:hypothetical protein